METKSDIMDFRAMPKIELHAHLTGSITPQTLHEIWLKKNAAGSTANDLDDPLVVMTGGGQHGRDLVTFFPLFTSYIYALISDLESLTYSTRSVIRDFANDGVVYLELRTTPRKLPSAKLDKAGYVAAVLAAIAEGERENPGIKVRLILSVDRRNSVEEALVVLELARRFMSGDGNEGGGGGGVVGIDLCGDVACGDVATFTPVMNAAREAGLFLTIHFAEAAHTGTDEELGTILDWRPTRLGHVIHVSDRVKGRIVAWCREHEDAPIGLELCLSSNVQLKMIMGGYDVHHFGEWYAIQGGPVITPCTDDVGVFDSQLSNEWRLLQQNFNLSRDEITALGRKSIDVIFGGDAEKARLREIMW